MSLFQTAPEQPEELIRERGHNFKNIVALQRTGNDQIIGLHGRGQEKGGGDSEIVLASL